MNINKEEKELLVAACQTEQARMARAINSTPNFAIKEILRATLVALQAIQARVSNEVPK